jgi:hypothetical protein
MIMRHAAVLIAMLTLSAACDRSAPGETSTARNVAADSAIYAVLLDSLRGTGDSVLVAREFDELPDSAAKVPAIAGWAHTRRPTVDSALVVALAASRYSGSLASTIGAARGVRWFLDPRELGKQTSVPRYRILSFTRIAYDSSRTQAVVYASMGCGGLCGNGSFYAFELRQGRWLKVGQVVLIIS